jgi:hypothetical protein
MRLRGSASFGARELHGLLLFLLEGDEKQSKCNPEDGEYDFEHTPDHEFLLANLSILLS